jgi:TM2 domain-containing membrane protein YozV
MVFLSNSGQSVTLNSDMYVTGGLSSIFTNSAVNGSGRLYIGGNITPTQTIAGTAVIEMYGSSNANLDAGTLANSLIINKTTAGVIVTLTGSLVWGAAGRTLNLNSNTNFTTNNVTLTLVGTPLTIINASNSQFYNLTTAAGTQTININ